MIMGTSKRDQILAPFAHFKDLEWPYKITKGFVYVYQTEMTAAQARGFLDQLGYVSKRDNKGAMGYSKTVGRFTVVAVFNKGDKSMLVAGERAR